MKLPGGGGGGVGGGAITSLRSTNHRPWFCLGSSDKQRTAQKDTKKDITSESQVNSNFPYRWSPASLTFNVYFYLFSYLYITRITVNIITPHLKSPKNQNRGARPGTSSNKITGGLKHEANYNIFH